MPAHWRWPLAPSVSTPTATGAPAAIPDLRRVIRVQRAGAAAVAAASMMRERPHSLPALSLPTAPARGALGVPAAGAPRAVKPTAPPAAGVATAAPVALCAAKVAPLLSLARLPAMLPVPAGKAVRVAMATLLPPGQSPGNGGVGAGGGTGGSGGGLYSPGFFQAVACTFTANAAGKGGNGGQGGRGGLGRPIGGGNGAMAVMAATAALAEGRTPGAHQRCRTFWLRKTPTLQAALAALVAPAPRLAPAVLPGQAAWAAPAPTSSALSPPMATTSLVWIRAAPASPTAFLATASALAPRSIPWLGLWPTTAAPLSPARCCTAARP